MLSRTCVRLMLTQSRPPLQTILPKKKAFNRLLFDNDSRLPYGKVLPILNTVYDNLDRPENILLPKYTTDIDLMVLRSLLHDLRSVTKSINKNLVDLENELVEQAAELGNNDAICMLAFETIGKEGSPKEDYNHATSLIKQLTEMKHPLVFKMAGDLAFSKGYHRQAEQYWISFLDLENNTILASHVYSNLGIYYFNYQSPKPNLEEARVNFEKAIRFGELDSHTVKLHFFLGQLYSITDPVLSRYHLEVAASRGLQESFASLGFLELNVFNNAKKSLEWFKLGVESNSDISCLIGQFDAHVKLNNSVNALNILTNLRGLKEKIEKVLSRSVDMPSGYRDTALSNQNLLEMFFRTRSDAVKRL